MRSAAAAITLGAGVLVIAAVAGPTQASPRVGDWTAELMPVNGGGSGLVHLHQRGTHLEVDLSAVGLDDGIHLAHIHGMKQAQAECPALSGATDADGNGLVDIGEGLPFYGGVLRTLSDGLDDTGTSLAYERIFKHLDNGDAIASLGDLDQYAVVVHGVDLGDGDDLATSADANGDGPGNADNEISMPALCGVITPH